MSSNMATGGKAMKVLTSYKQYELKRVKVAIRRHNIKPTANNNQPLLRDVDDPLSISSLVHTSGTEYGRLFRKVIPNTIQLPPEAYVKPKPDTGELKSEPSPPPEPGPSRQRSASCSSDEAAKDDRRAKSQEKCNADEPAPVAKPKRRSPERERDRERLSRVPSAGGSATHAYEPVDTSPESPFDKRKARSTSPSPPPRPTRARRRHSRSRSRSPTREKFRSRSPREKGRSRSPRRSKSNHRRSSRRTSRTPSRERHRSPGSRERHRSPGSRDRRRNGSRSTSRERRTEFPKGVDYYPRGYYDPNLIRAAQMQLFPQIPPFHPAAALPAPFFNRPFYAAPDAAIAPFPPRPRKELPVYNSSRRIPNFAVKPGPGPTCTITSNGGNLPPNGELHESAAPNGKAL